VKLLKLISVDAKAASGGGGRGMRIIRKEQDLQLLSICTSALNAFGDATMF
jgi:pyruvate carboxylase